MTKIHTFAICAYKESRYLEDCIKSVIKQNDTSEVILCSSTPSTFLSEISSKYDIPLFIRDGNSDIQDDWNFAVDCTKTDWVTIAHQDDIYNENYSKELVDAIKKEPTAIMAFTDYLPIKDGQLGTDLNSRMKRIFRSPMRVKSFRHNKVFRKYIQSFGNAISCPSVAYNKKLITGPVFTSTLKFALDWDTFVKLADTKYPFIYLHKKLFYYRVHDEATSKEFTVNNTRIEEELYMFKKFWPDFLIKLGFRLYQRSYKTYD